MTDPVLIATDVSLTLGGHAILDRVDLAARPGELVALCGPNGAGKTTLLRVLAGELTPSTGSVALTGRPLDEWKLRDLARMRAVLPQQTTIEFAFMAREVVALGLHARVDDIDEAHVVADALAATESTHFADRLYARLSGGEAGRVNLSRVLAQGATVLLLDEPTAALDIRHQALTMATARRLADEGCAVIAVLHDLNLAAAYTDRIVLMHAGRVRADAPPDVALDPDLITKIYEHPISVIPHPLRGGVLVITDATPHAESSR